MDPCPFLRSPGVEGSRFAGGFRWLQSFGDLQEIQLLGTEKNMLIPSDVPRGLFTLYEALVRETEPIILGLDSLSCLIPYDPNEGFSPTVKEICAGMGGMGLGCSFLGGQVLASLDCSSLACEHLIRNDHGLVLCRDLRDDRAKQELHVLGGRASTLMAGFPCQPHSTQGSQRGSADPRHGVLTEVLRTAYLHMTKCLILECTPQAQFDTGVRQEIEALAEIMNWAIHDITLALSHQWPCRRHRWWVLCPTAWDSASLQKWPYDDQFQAVNTILPNWGLWPSDQEAELQLTVQEYVMYSNPNHGRDKRILALDDMAPTFLHSYGSALGTCPCGCRQTPFSCKTLLDKGLRGCFVESRLHGQPRYLHPLELFALHGIPLTVTPLPNMRAALCLVGQIASPLQALWIFSWLVALANGQDESQAMAEALERLGMVKRQLVRDHFHLWRQPDHIPRQLSVRLPDGAQITILASGTTTVAQLLRAETFTLAPGEMLHLCDGSRMLPDDQILLEHGAYGPYCIQVTQNINPSAPQERCVVFMKHGEEVHVAIVFPGVSLFQAMQQCQLQGISHFEDEDGKFYGLDYRVWHSLRISAHTRVNIPPQMAFGLAPGHEVGLTDVTVWHAMVSICRSSSSPYDEPPLMITPSMADALLTGTFTPFQCDGLRALFKESDGMIYCIFAANHHWALLCGNVENKKILWTYFDGLHSSVLTEASRLAWTLSFVLQMPCGGVEPFSLQPQTLPHTCGTIAIMHLCLVLGLDGHFAPEDEFNLHNALVRHQGAKTSFRPLDKSYGDLPERLAAFLEEKGVPPDATHQRATEAIKILGSASILEALQTANPWATLKGLASRPNTRFRWVKEQELKAHVEQQARKKHGAHVPKAKQKKQVAAADKQIPQVDPSTLRLLPDTFVDGDDDEIQQIAFGEVAQDATGLAFCTYLEAKPFIEAANIISSTTLGLLINTEVPTDFWGEAAMEHLCFPALCTVTDEPLLLRGTLLTLSDGVIRRKERESLPLPVLDTNIVKAQIFQDEVNMSWQQVTDGPVRALLQAVPQFRLCHGRQCGKDCAFFHAPVGESLQGVILDIWARGYFNVHGKATKAEHANYFQVMLRIPTVALDLLLRSGTKGVYIEPRSSTAKGPHEAYCVIWLAGHDRDQALHKLRTCTHGIAVARLHQRYGVRVAKAHEKKTHEELRPDDDFVDVEVKHIYTIFPVPYGVQRSQMVKLLAAWKWEAKPLQPVKGNLQGQAWTIGATDAPPNKVLPGFGHDILVTLQKDVTAPAHTQTLVASSRTRKFLKEGTNAPASSASGDPWFQGQDPWASWQKPNTPAGTVTAAPVSRFSHLQDTIRDEVQKQVQHAPPGLTPNDDVKRLEVNIAELQAQGHQFQTWFQEAGQRMQTTEQQLGQLRQVVEQQGQAVAAQISEIQQEVDNKTQILQSTLQGSVAAMSKDLSSAPDSKLTSQFDRFEAMLAKKSRSE